MSHDDFETERVRVERVIEILEHVTAQLEAGQHVPLSVLRDATAFISRSEEAAYEAMLDEDEPTLSRCLEQHTVVRRPLGTMQEALGALADGEAAAAGRFAGAVAAYAKLRREHLALDDRLFARAARSAPELDVPSMPVELVESPETRRLYDRVVEAAALLNIGASTAFPNAQAGRSRSA
jgi:hemerythrin-like domain-containing protein